MRGGRKKKLRAWERRKKIIAESSKGELMGVTLFFADH